MKKIMYCLCFLLILFMPISWANQHKLIVLIDPGHGGRDSGAVGKQGLCEKNVVLIVAKKLCHLINQQSGMKAILTREGDYYVPLAARLKIARKHKVDLFVSIHADSFFNDQSQGVSIFALSKHGATSLAARWLAIRENHSELGNLDLRELHDQSAELRSLLIDLAQTASNTRSLRLGKLTLKALSAVTPLHYSHVEQAPFMVLKSPDIPSILVEIGFLSNSHEELKLREPCYQMKLAQAIFKGIQQYKKTGTV